MAPPLRAVKRSILRMRASKHMRPELIRGIKKKGSTTMHSFLPPPVLANRTLDTEVENAKDKAQDTMAGGSPMDKPMKRMRRGSVGIMPPRGLMPPS